MATSLAEQLKRLSVPQTASLRKSDKYRVSFLYDPKEAANLDRSTVYYLGVNGLEELILIDEDFKQFEENLFDEGSQAFERSIQTDEVNKKLDGVISDFLFRLSPYILLRPAHKALEWLVNRFHIHLYNEDDLVRCFLPYHGTTIFVRAIQMLDLKTKDSKWQWLESVQKSGVPLAKSAIINYAERNLNFLRFICDIIEPISQEKDEQKVKKYQVLVSFYSSTIVAVIRQCKNDKKHNLLTLLLTYILNGLRSPIPDIKCTSLTFISQLAVKNAMKEKLFETFVKNVAKVSSSNVSSEAIMCLLVLYQTQKYEMMPKKCLLRFQGLNFLVNVLCELEEEFRVSPFVFPVLLGCVNLLRQSTLNKDKKKVKLNKLKKDIPDHSHYLKLFKKIVRKLKLDGDVVRATITKVIEIKLSKAIDKKLTAQILSLFETKYPDVFDEVLEKFFDKASQAERSDIQNVLNTSAYSEKQKQSSKAYANSLYLNLNHPKHTRRHAAIQKLIQRIRNDKEKNHQFISDALVARLHDEHYQIPMTILNEFEVVGDFIPADKLFEALKVVLDKHKLKTRGPLYVELKSLALNAMCSKQFISKLSSDALNHVIVYLFAFIFPTNPSSLTIIRKLSTSYLFKTHKLFLGLKDVNSEDISEFFKCMIEFISGRFMELETNEKFNLIQLLIDQCNVRSKSTLQLRFVVISLLKQLILLHPKDESIKLSSILLTLCAHCLKLKWMLHSDASNSPTPNLKSYFEILQDNNRLPIPFIAESITVVIKSIRVSDQLRDNPWWSSCADESSLLGLMIELFNLLTEQASSEDDSEQTSLFRKLLQDFIQISFKDAHLFIRFLSVTWTSHTQPQSESVVKASLVTQARALSVARSFFRFGKILWLNEKNNPAIILLLVALDNAPQPVCILALDCLQEIYNREDIGKLIYKSLISRFVKFRAELEMDFEQLPVALSKACKHNQLVLDLLLETLDSNQTPDYVKASVLRSLSLTTLTKGLPLLCNMAIGLLSSESLTESQGKIVQRILERFNPKVVASAPDQEMILNVLTSAFNSKLTFSHSQTTCCQFTLTLISKELFRAFTDSNQHKFFEAIVELQVSNRDPELTDTINRILRKTISDSSHVVTVLRKLLASLPQAPLTIRPVKRRKIDAILQEKVKESNNETEKWKGVSCVLETLQKKKNVKSLPELIPLLFDLLKRCLELEDQNSVEQRKQLILTCIHHCCSKLPAELIKERLVNIDLVVKCLRASKDRQTHNDALILLSLMANLFPETILHNVMAIFTFMGTNMLRQDDYYSFEIMARTTKAVVPTMLATHSATGGQNKIVFLVLRIFVDAFPDMPVHRRRAIFVQLLDSLDPELFLGTTLGLLLQLSVTFKNRVDGETRGKLSLNKEVSNSAIKFALTLTAAYLPFVQLKASVELFHILAELPIEKRDVGARRPLKPRDIVFDVNVRSAKELRHFQFVCVTFVASVISGELFIEQISNVRESQPEMFEEACKSLLEQVLHFSNRVAVALEANSSNDTYKFWKTLLHRTYEVLDKLNALLPGSIFVTVVSGLMESKLSIVRRKAMELLNSRLQFHPDAFQDKEVSSLAVLVNPVLRVLENDDEADTTGANQQMALLSLKMLCRLFGSQQQDQLGRVLDVVISSFTRNVEHELICGSALLCLVEVCACLGAHAISSLHKFMPSVSDILCNHSRLFKQELLLLSVISSVLRLVEVLSHFLSPYLPGLIQQICLISNHEVSIQKPAVSSKLTVLRHKIATLVPTRVLLPAITRCYENFMQASKQAVQSLMSILAECITAMDKDTRLANMSTLQTFFLTSLDYRVLHSNEVVTTFEEYLFEPILALVMKLSEASFRPFFYKIFNWATQLEAPKDRAITFYHLADKIADKLKSLFLLFAGHLVQNASMLLNENNTIKGELMFESTDKCCLLIDYILQTLHKCFLYDKEGFVNKERFDTLVNPLVDQIENELSGYDERVKNLLAPCLGQLAEATADEANWKTLNYQILLKTRDKSDKIRIGALQCVDELHRHLEKDYLSLLPESVPFLAELMEDESTEVEHKCQTVIAAMETSLGEPLQKYFNAGL